MSRRASQFDQGGGKWRAEWSEVEEACGNGWRRPGWRVIRSRVTDSLDGLPAHTYNTHNNGVWRSVENRYLPADPVGRRAQRFG
ncbi:hypothetical protein ABWI05_22830, partial [Rhodococcus baikonurensis]